MSNARTIASKIFSVILGLTFLGSLVNILPTHAVKLPGQDGERDVCPPSGCEVLDPTQYNDADVLPEIVSIIGSLMTFVLATVAVIFLIWGAYEYMMDPDKGPEKGRKRITNAIIAIVIAVLSFSITQIVVNFLANFDADTE